MPHTRQQADALAALEWLLSEDQADRATGRSIVWAVALIRQAVRQSISRQGRGESATASRGIWIAQEHIRPVEEVLQQLGIFEHFDELRRDARGMGLRLAEPLPPLLHQRLFEQPFPELTTSSDGHTWVAVPRRALGRMICSRCGSVGSAPTGIPPWDFNVPESPCQGPPMREVSDSTPDPQDVDVEAVWQRMVERTSTVLEPTLPAYAPNDPALTLAIQDIRPRGVPLSERGQALRDFFFRGQQADSAIEEGTIEANFEQMEREVLADFAISAEDRRRRSPSFGRPAVEEPAPPRVSRYDRIPWGDDEGDD